MDSHEERSIARLYREPYDFTMSVHDDMETFINLKEYGALHDIDGQRVPCVVSSRSLKPYTSRQNDEYDSVITRGIVLWIKSEYVRKAEPEVTVRVDGRLYVIESASSIQGEMWRIELGVCDG